MSTIRIEADGATDLSRVHSWLLRHRGQIVELDDSTRLALGVPISGARAVIVAVALQDDHRTGPQLGGVLRALANRTDREPVRLVFDVRSAGGLGSAEAEAAAGTILDGVAKRIAADDLVEQVA
jgi:hypothetical protein